DATLVFDLETAARIGVIGEYRYDWSRQARGIFTFGYFNESIGGTPETLQPISPTQAAQETPENRWIVAGRHTQPFLSASPPRPDAGGPGDARESLDRGRAAHAAVPLGQPALPGRPPHQRRQLPARDPRVHVDRPR